MHAIVTRPRPANTDVVDVATTAGCRPVASCELSTTNESVQLTAPCMHVRLFRATPAIIFSHNTFHEYVMESARAKGRGAWPAKAVTHASASNGNSASFGPPRDSTGARE